MPPELLRSELNLEVWRGALAVRWALVEQSRVRQGIKPPEAPWQGAVEPMSFGQAEGA